MSSFNPAFIPFNTRRTSKRAPKPNTPFSPSTEVLTRQRSKLRAKSTNSPPPVPLYVPPQAAAACVTPPVAHTKATSVVKDPQSDQPLKKSAAPP